ncbi:MAG: gamma-glutamylcyclotransferase [Bacteroidetes bacterium]|nr:gamma-glutamylcyclotransferase [Bacteroidota bacterium]
MIQTPSLNSLFVYGSLRSGFRSDAYTYISNFFDLIGIGKVRGRLYDMGKYPAAKPGIDEHYITGELYHIRNASDFSWAIGQLDVYEGVCVEEDEMQLYYRDITEVQIGIGKVPAWIYWFNGSVENRKLIESGDLMEYYKPS